MAQVFESADLDVVDSFLQDFYASMRLNAPGDRHGLRIEQEQLPGVQLVRATYHMQVEADVESTGMINIVRVLDGRLGYPGQGAERRYRRGDVFLVAQPDAAFHGSVDFVDTRSAFIDPALLQEVAQSAPGDHRPVRLLAHEPVNPAAGEQWWQVYEAVTSSIAASPELVANPLVTANAARLITAVTLATFPNSALVDPTIEDRHDAHPGALRRAVAFIEANPHHDLTPVEIAAAAFVSVRAVQLAFRRHLDTTPLGYLRKVRLDRAHHDLVAADPARDTVTDIATRWGFAHLSRFAGHYRAAYGVPPSTTLNRSG